MQNSGINKSNDLLLGLSPAIVREIKKDFFLRILKTHIIFSSNFTEKFLRELSLYMDELILAPDENLYKSQD